MLKTVIYTKYDLFPMLNYAIVDSATETEKQIFFWERPMVIRMADVPGSFVPTFTRYNPSRHQMHEPYAYRQLPSS